MVFTVAHLSQAGASCAMISVNSALASGLPPVVTSMNTSHSSENCSRDLFKSDIFTLLPQFKKEVYWKFMYRRRWLASDLIWVNWIVPGAAADEAE